MTNNPAGSPVASDGGSSSDQSPDEKQQTQTVEIPLSAVGQVKAGDTITLKVISVDEQGGVVNAAPMSQQAEEGPEAGGSDSLAAELDNPKNQ